jgi:hypothetical protein
LAGRTQIAWRGPSVSAAFRRGTARGLEAAAAELLAESQKIVPFEKGELSRSGASGMVNDHTAAVTYTAPSAVYAHERLNIPPGHGRQRKYLETPMMTGRRIYAAALAARIRREAGT